MNKLNLTVNILPLRFSFGNTKLTKGQIIFDLVAGYSCPFAKLCRYHCDKDTGKLIDGAFMLHRCYAASCETRPLVRAAHWRNFNLLTDAKTTAKMLALFKEYLPYGIVYRFHSSGDFFSQAYFDAFLALAASYPERIFYAYTKALPFWVKRLGSIPKNVRLNASYGGTHDHLIAQYNLKSVSIVSSLQEAQALGLEIDHDDSHAWQQEKSFALMLHGNGPKGSIQAKMQSVKVHAARRLALAA